jgi:hypothetical protein
VSPPFVVGTFGDIYASLITLVRADYLDIFFVLSVYRHFFTLLLVGGGKNAGKPECPLDGHVFVVFPKGEPNQPWDLLVNYAILLKCHILPPHNIACPHNLTRMRSGGGRGGGVGGGRG